MSIYTENNLDFIDKNGFRSNVGIIIMNRDGNLLWARRYGKKSWQFPQGGIHKNETPTQAMWRELKEEVDLCPQKTRIIAHTRKWLYYKIPKNLLRDSESVKCIGQKQKWFLLLLDCNEKDISFDKTDKPEFDALKFVSYWYPIRKVVGFKRNVYRQALLELLPYMQKTLQNLDNQTS